MCRNLHCRSFRDHIGGLRCHSNIPVTLLWVFDMQADSMLLPSYTAPMSTMQERMNVVLLRRRGRTVPEPDIQAGKVLNLLSLDHDLEALSSRKDVEFVYVEACSGQMLATPLQPRRALLCRCSR